jgi:hypothetical protein
MKESDKMFSFFHRTPEIHVDCFTFSHSAYEYTPIVYANKTLPEWWKELPSSSKPIFGEKDGNKHMPINRKTMTAKDCYAIIEFYKKGIVLENWCDYSVKVENDEINYCWSSGLGADVHVKEQLGNSFPNHLHLKLFSPWKLKEKTGIKFMWVGDEWSLHEHMFKVLPGIVSYDINTTTNVNIMLPKIDLVANIPIGVPLIHIVPLSEKRLKFKNHLISEMDWNNINIDGLLQSFYGWRKALKLRKRNKERGTCPFGFGDKS